jgi:predicted N-acyltransferase
MEVELVPDFSAVAPEAWDALIGRDNPFVTWAFLRHLETSRSVGPGTGWVPAHILVRDQSGDLIAACPNYLKDDSYGEYIFDWGWADASERNGIRYYPKLVVGVPFTPATGPRLLVHPEAADPDALRTLLGEALISAAEELDASSVHVLFCTEDEAEVLARGAFFRRGTHQFHWRNPGYEDFDDFLSQLRSSARKQLRKERRRVRESGVELSLRPGDEVTDEEWVKLFRLYTSTSNRKWGRPYLTRAFFRGAREAIGPLARVAFARDEGEIIAGALSFARGDHLYGRYWGTFRDVDCLHFELCYYQLIDAAIREGRTLVEAGAQGPHKLKRGFLPVMTHSAHHLRHPRLHAALEQAMGMERDHLERELAEVQAEGPFREDGLPPFRPSAGIALPSLRPPVPRE